jgi:hypothetical protein
LGAVSAAAAAKTDLAKGFVCIKLALLIETRLPELGFAHGPAFRARQAKAVRHAKTNHTSSPSTAKKASAKKSLRNKDIFEYSKMPTANMELT